MTEKQRRTKRPPRQPDDRHLSMWVSGDLYRALKTKMAAEDTTITQIVEETLRRALGLPAEEEGRKGGVLYPAGGLPAMRTCDR